jgi:hypothetical protein
LAGTGQAQRASGRTASARVPRLDGEAVERGSHSARPLPSLPSTCISVCSPRGKLALTASRRVSDVCSSLHDVNSVKNHCVHHSATQVMETCRVRGSRPRAGSPRRPLTPCRRAFRRGSSSAARVPNLLQIGTAPATTLASKEEDFLATSSEVGRTKRSGSGSRSRCTAEIYTYLRHYLSNILDTGQWPERTGFVVLRRPPQATRCRRRRATAQTMRATIAATTA